MFRWGKKKKDHQASPKEPQAGSPAEGQDSPQDWDFLRSQPDYDADEMQAVHGGEECAPEPGKAEPAAEVASAARPESGAPTPDLLDLPDPIEPRRKPRRVEESVVGSTPDSRAGEHATKPLTLLSELCARFQDPTDVRPEWEQPSWGVPGWALTLEITVKGRKSWRLVSGEALIGRPDPAVGHVPDVDLSPDDTISRRHARIYERGGRYWLRDLDSMNGTRHNGEWLSPGGEAALAEGDEILLGEFCSIHVVDPVMHTDEADLRDLLQMALGGTLCAEREAQAPGVEVPTPATSDLLDVALERGTAVGLIWDPERP